MNLTCERCSSEFDADRFRGYCPGCVQLFSDEREAVHARQRPSPNVFADGKFTDKACPQTVFDPVAEHQVCGLCGSEDIEHGYGIGSGYGCGVYMFCNDCNNFLDFSEDRS